MMRAMIVAGFLLFASPALAIDDVLLGHIETVLDFVATMSANCAQHYDEGMAAGARAKLNFSQAEIAAYCVCSTSS